MSDRQGYEVPRTILRLEFTDPSFDGLLIRAYAPPSWAVSAAGGFAFIDPDAPLTRDLYERFVKIREAFGAALVEWNMRDDTGQPLAATAESVGNLEDQWLAQLVAAWIDGARQLTRAALAARRVDEADLPMEIG